ncbi:ABC transporter permease [Pleionea sediminis]|uniref:ABC transporter permease n=1 Tax=Pleionea sediminis TaxID=2569479 RepID=UPI0011863AF4|nr:ABC transporter permease [Pleionea sediminis]
MFVIKRFIAIFIARNREFFRDRAALTWNLAFPVLLIVGFSIVFSGDSRNQLKVGLLNESSVPQSLSSIKYTEFLFYQDQNDAQNKVAQHQLDLLLDWKNKIYWINDTSPNGFLAENVIQNHTPKLKKESISGEPIRYIDWVIPGILGMNIMFSCLFGVGYVIVRYRKSGVLKRLNATPITAFEFIAAQIVSRLIIVTSISVVIFLSTWWTIGFMVKGSLLLLLLILVLGTLCLIALGLMIASRSQSEELTGGLLNFASWPMMFLSGVWFSLEGSPEIIQFIAQWLPLTHFVNATRAIMTEGASFMSVLDNILALILMTSIFFILSAFSFNWGKSR